MSNQTEKNFDAYRKIAAVMAQLIEGDMQRARNKELSSDDVVKVIKLKLAIDALNRIVGEDAQDPAPPGWGDVPPQKKLESVCPGRRAMLSMAK